MDDSKPNDARSGQINPDAYRVGTVTGQGAPPPGMNTPGMRGFDQSTKRTILEIGGLVVAILGGLALLVWLGLKVLAWGATSMMPYIPISVDEALGQGAWAQYAAESKRCTDPGPLAYVEALAAPLTEQLGGPFTFKFAVVDDDSINAFALPGGFVTVHMGLLKAAESGEEVAAVLAHELQHVQQRHGMTRLIRQQGGIVLLGLLVGYTDLGTLIAVATSMAQMSYDRDQEREADEKGHELLRKASIDPRGMEKFFARLKAEGGPNIPAILSTHPDTDERVESAAQGPGLSGPARVLASPKGLRCHP